MFLWLVCVLVICYVLSYFICDRCDIFETLILLELNFSRLIKGLLKCHGWTSTGTVG
jgi:hypothetical protein